ncbi:MAG: type II toxin-antitoxin system RelE/ParE family toxin [Patescibacteria group bacterium]
MRKGESEWLVGWTPISKADILEIGSYVSRIASHATAESLMLSIHSAGEGLLRHPYLWRARDDVLKEVRFAPLRSYFICYRIKATTIEILRIIHQKRDVAALFADIDTQI